MVRHYIDVRLLVDEGTPLDLLMEELTEGVSYVNQAVQINTSVAPPIEQDETRRSWSGYSSNGDDDPGPLPDQDGPRPNGKGPDRQI